jgi:hypothetical protein
VTERGTWKAYERACAHDHGSERIPVNGRCGPDFESATVCAQVKLRKGRPKQLETWLHDIESHAKPGQMPVVIWRIPHEDRGRAVVLMRYADWLRLSPWGESANSASCPDNS